MQPIVLGIRSTAHAGMAMKNKYRIFLQAFNCLHSFCIKRARLGDTRNSAFCGWPNVEQVYAIVALEHVTQKAYRD